MVLDLFHSPSLMCAGHRKMFSLNINIHRHQIIHEIQAKKNYNHTLIWYWGTTSFWRWRGNSFKAHFLKGISGCNEKCTQGLACERFWSVRAYVWDFWAFVCFDAGGVFVSRSTGCIVSCLILSFPPVNQTENSPTLIPPQLTHQREAWWMWSCLSVTAGRAALILPIPLPFLLLIRLCHSRSHKGWWTNKQQLHSDPKN